MERPRVLLVEDDRIFRGFLIEYIEEAKGRPLVYPNSIEALAHIRREDPYHLALSDLSFPNGPGGYILARASKDLHPDVPFWLMSSYALIQEGMADRSFSKENTDQILGPALIRKIQQLRSKL
jgi:DNA-binding NtrC family response regulator